MAAVSVLPFLFLVSGHLLLHLLLSSTTGVRENCSCGSPDKGCLPKVA